MIIFGINSVISILGKRQLLWSQSLLFFYNCQKDESLPLTLSSIEYALESTRGNKSLYKHHWKFILQYHSLPPLTLSGKLIEVLLFFLFLFPPFFTSILLLLSPSVLFFFLLKHLPGEEGAVCCSSGHTLVKNSSPWILKVVRAWEYGWAKMKA